MSLTWEAALAGAEPRRPVDRLAIEGLKRELPPEFVLAHVGDLLSPSGDRLVGKCPFHGGSDSFGLYSLPDDEAPLRRVGCWNESCEFRGGDVLDYIQARYRVDLPRAVDLGRQFLDALRAEPGWKPTRVEPARRADPADLTEQARAAVDAARADASAIERLIDEKRTTDPGWRLVTPGLLIEEWGVGAESDWLVSIPHYGADGLVRGLKTRTARSKTISRAGSELSALYGSHRDRGRGRVLLVEGESDAWVASAYLEGQDVDVLALPSGARSRIRDEWLGALRGRDVLIAFDGDDAGRAATEAWRAALAGVARVTGAVALAEGRDVASTPLPELTLAWLDQAAPEPDGPRRSFRILSRAEVDEMPEPEWLVWRLIPRVGTGQIHGPSNLGKTFVTMDLALSVAGREPEWHGYPIREWGNVVYLALEDEGDWKARVQGWEAAHQGCDTSALYTAFADDGVDLADERAVAEWVEAFGSLSPVMVVVDTQARATPGTEENSNRDMGVVMDNLRRLATRLGCFVMTVHHTGWNAHQGRARGASAQRGALDVEIAVKPPPRGRGADDEDAAVEAETDTYAEPITGVVQVVKNRRAAKRPPTGFRLDRSGGSVHARYVPRANGAEGREDDRRTAAVLAAMRHLGGVANSMAELKRAVRETGGQVGNEAAFRRVVDEMCGEGGYLHHESVSERQNRYTLRDDAPGGGS